MAAVPPISSTTTVPPSTASSNPSDARYNNNNNNSASSKMSVSDFVTASFAKFEAQYGPSTLVEVSSGKSASRMLAGRHHHTNNSNGSALSMDDDCKQHSNDNHHHHHMEEDEEDEEPFWSLILTLYLPLLFFGLRRTTFGTFSFLRSLLLGHVLRILISVASFSIPSRVSERVERWWKRAATIYWVQHVLWAVTGEERYHPHQNHDYQGNSIHHGGDCGEGLSPSKGVSLNSSSVSGGSSGRKSLKDHVWPPPALTLLTLITVVAFVVHPDGLTWIFLGKVLDGIVYLFRLSYAGFGMIKDGTITTLAASLVFTGLILFGGLIHRTLSSKSKQRGSEDGSTSSGVGALRKNKKGKKGKSGGRHGHQNSSRGRGKVRGGNNRYESTRDNSRSRSGSPSRDDSLRQDVDGILKGSEKDGSHVNDNTSKERNNSAYSSRNETTQSQDGLSKQRPYSTDSSLPQLSDDVSSCSSIAGSLIDVPGNKHPKGTDDSDKSTTESGSRRKNKRGPKRGKNLTTVTGTPTSVSAAAVRAPPGFVARDPTMTPSRVSPLTVSNSASSPVRASPARKAVSRPILPSSKISRTNDNTSSNGLNHPTQALRNRASTCDGVVKRAYSAPMTNNVALVSNSSLSQSVQQPVRYGLPNYTAYAQNDGRYAPGKIELAAFLAQVGLVGSACAELLADLFDVDELAALSPDELYSYKVGTEKQLEIAALLEARRLRLVHQKQQQQQLLPSPNVQSVPSSVVRPPPGFSGSNATGSSLIASAVLKPVSPPVRALPQSQSFAPERTSDFFLPSSNAQNNGSNNFNLPSFNNNSLDTSFLVRGDPILNARYDRNNSARPLPIGSRLFVSNQEPVETDDDKIDADLQQLGDRMVGSILDF
ncbi:predicted protein [Thalassiosira pseudonana CCMP1335]|uniref:Uncharacterized protein n=1 Tax=Thalassiosira pseudonana TaxID=35128 RepID=B8BYS0_THAPS|nr:predicted protein [Thalassiosira pseudonana CCMP1335]EED94424.1 predicted protein [Thalassiosira pseudonana CCMP1335]